MKPSKPTYRLDYVKGSGGDAVYLNDYRLTKQKPWGGGEVIRSWEITVDDLRQAIPELNKK